MSDRDDTVLRNTYCMCSNKNYFKKNLIIYSQIISINLFHCDLELNCTLNFKKE